MNRAATPILIVGLSLSACAPAPPPPSRSAPAAENAALALRVTELPEGIRLAANEGDRLAFDAASEGVPGNLVVSVGPPVVAGVNLVEEANGFGASAEAAGGEYFGGNQVVTPYGSGFVTRVLVDQGGTEELRAFLLHPGDRDRLMTVSLGYPPGGPEVSRARMNQLLGFLGALEPLETPEQR